MAIQDVLLQKVRNAVGQTAQRLFSVPQQAFNMGQQFGQRAVPQIQQRLQPIQQQVQKQVTNWQAKPSNQIFNQLKQVPYNIGTQMQKVNVPTLNIPTPLKLAFPAFTGFMPEIINQNVQAYGRTLANPSENKLETALNILPMLPVAKVKIIANLAKAKQIKALGMDIENAIYRVKNYETFNPTYQMGVINSVKKTAQKAIPEIINTKELKYLEKTDQRQWLNTVSKFMEDKLVQARNPSYDFGLSVKKLGKLSGKEMPQTGKLSDRLTNAAKLPDFEKLKLKYEKEKLMGKPIQGQKQLMKDIYSQPQTGGVGGATIPKVQGSPVPVEQAMPKVVQAKPIQSEVKVAGGPLSGGPVNPSLPYSIPDDATLVKTLTEKLKSSSKQRGTQEELYTKAKGVKLAKMMSAREKMAGEKGFYSELGALKGELPKIEYDPIRQSFDQPSVDRLFNMIKENKTLDEWDKINAQVGLSKILGEKGVAVPTKSEISKLYEVYGKDFTEALLSKRSTFEKLKELGMQMYNLPRSLMAGVGDLSGTLMQNAMFAYRHPILTGKNFIKELQFFRSEKAFKISQEEISSRPTYQLMKQAKLSLTDTGPLVSNREEQFMSSLAEKIPGLGRLVKATGRAYTGFLNRMRADVFDQLVNTQKQLGGAVNDAKFLKDVGHFVNIATGRGDLGQMERVAPVMGQGFFSARKLMATFQTLDPRLYITSTPVVRREALLTLLSFLGGATAITELSKLAGADVSDDPTSSDFGKIKFGNTRFNMYGPYQQLAVLFARQWKGYATSSITGKKMMLGDESNPYSPSRLDLLTRYFESKEHPTLSLILSAMRGTNNIGQPFNATTETLNRFVPMMLADGYDLYKEHGPVGLLGTIPAILGIPAQTYGTQIPTMKQTPTGRPSIKLNPTGGIVEDVVGRITNQQPSNIPQSQWQGIINTKTQAAQLSNMKSQVKEQALKGNMSPMGNLVPIVDKGNVKIIDTSEQPVRPVMTGSTELDKLAISKYNSSVTSKINDIYDLFTNGKLTQQDANNQIAKLKASKITGSGISALKPRKPSLGKLKKFTVKKTKLPKLKKIKAKKIKFTKIKSINYKPLKVKKGG